MNILPVFFQTGVRKTERTGASYSKDPSGFDDVYAAKAAEERKSGEEIPAFPDEAFCFSPVSDGTKTLTEAQKKYLSGQFDVTNMTMKDKHRLLGRLTVFGALSGQELLKVMERDTGLAEVLTGEIVPVEGAEDVFTAAVAYDYDGDVPVNWVERHQEFATEEFQKFVFSGQNGGNAMGIGGEFDSRIASLLRQLIGSAG